MALVRLMFHRSLCDAAVNAFASHQPIFKIRRRLSFALITAATSRHIHNTPIKHHGEFEWQDPKSDDEVVNVTYVTKEGNHVRVRGKNGDNLLFLAHRYEIEMEGACEASLACTTCHVYVKDDYLDQLPEATEEEEDLLDLAPFLKSNSRLGCQIILNKSLEGLEVTLPSATRNFYVDGKTPSKH